ncbi:MAG: hypothetical protein KTR31_02545 [Myxococcales bacterium]|nr:hypothetical protein [Myxococcales bacterium]
MLRTAAAAMALTLGLTTADNAHAADGAYMWALGPTVGTIVIPGGYPASFPPVIENYNFVDEGPNAGDPNSAEPNRDLDENGIPIFTTLEPVRADVRVALEGFYGINSKNRVGGAVGVGGGTRFLDYWITANYDRVMFTDSQFNLVAGAGLGFGSMTFQGANDVEQLRIPYFPIRARVQGQILDSTRLYGLGLFVHTAVPSNTFYNDVSGFEQPSVGGPLNWILNLAAGVELTLQFGDLTPPKKGRPNKGGRKGGRQGGGGNDGGGRGR